MAERRDVEPTIEFHRLAADGAIPNNPRLPLLVYRAAVADGSDLAADFEAAFARNGWSGGWRDGIFSYHHYHSTAHEVLGVARGEARVRVGGPAGPVVAVHGGDVIVIPAGVAHKNEGASRDLLVVGAYPEGRGPDLRTMASADVEEAARNVARVPMPAADPVFGAGGPLFSHWREA